MSELPIPLPQDSNDSRPLPEIIADFYDFPLAYYDTLDERYYAVQDWIAGVAQTDVPRKFWHDVKRVAKKSGIELSGLTRKLPYRAANGKTSKVEFATIATLYLIAQWLRADTEPHNKVLEYLAKAGVVVDEIRIDPDKAIDAAIEAYRRLGKSEAWIQTRIVSKVARLYFTAAFHKSMRKANRSHYGIITNDVYYGLWKRSAAKIKEEMGLRAKDNLRDHQPIMALSYQLVAENLAAVSLEQRENLEFDQAQKIVKASSEHVGRQAEETSRLLGKDIATDRPLLPNITE